MSARFPARIVASRGTCNYIRMHRSVTALLSHPWPLGSRIPTATPSSRAFHYIPRLLKKKSRADRDAAEEARAALPTAGSDPHDFTTLLSGIAKCQAKLEADLAQHRNGGRFNPDVLGALRVSVSRDGKKTERLSDLAQIVPKSGRSLIIMVGEKAHIKPIMSAIQTSQNLNLQPQIDAQEPLHLNVPIPPSTKDSRDLAMDAMSKAGDLAAAGIRKERGVMQKSLRNIELKKLARPDDIKKAQKEMEKIVEKGGLDVKAMVNAARNALGKM
ncbi:CELP0024 Effector like protein [Blumeria hordei DH14]|uniref:CELP0024 Effector like protein n=1 Tax=Blumeria graminis f. sp. hordei (strain DH14) TaxID=546991 RepID=N1JBJ3_BLUG1|nr:CELP0024 Effector like protein [Blumeria hordei DH14]